MSYSDLALLACGNYDENSEIGEVLDNLANTIGIFEKRIFDLSHQEEDNITLLGPFYARTLLESSTTALIGRLDPFRLLFIKKMQQHGSYELGRPLNAAIRWSGDVIDKGKAPVPLWKSDKEFRSVERGLLGGYYGDVFWTPAFETFLDYPIEKQDFLEEYRGIASENFVNRMRDEALYVYSGLSKGVHSEFVIKPETIYDRASITQLIIRTLNFCSLLSLVSHGIDSVIAKLELESAIEIYTRFRERSDKYDG